MTDATAYRGLVEQALSMIAAGDTERGIAGAEEILTQYGNAPEAVYLLGLIAARMDEPSRTLELFKLAHDLAPNVREFADALAIACAKLGRLGDSLFYGKLAASLPPHPVIDGLLPEWFGAFEDAFLNIAEPNYDARGAELLGLGSVDDAVEMYRRQAEAKETDLAAWRAYAERMVEIGRAGPALLAMRRIKEAGAVDPRDEALTASCLVALGRFEAAREIHDAMLAEGRITLEALSLMIADMARDPDTPRAFIAQAERTLAETFPPTADSMLPSRAIETGSLKIGVVTSRFSLRGELDLFWPVLSAGRIAKAAVYVYANDVVEDSVARRLQGAVASWIDARAIDDLTLDAIIRNDGVHILIDLDGRRPGARPALFMRRPAPCALQLSGLPESAGAVGFDAVLGDAVLYPPHEDPDEGECADILRVEGGLFRLPLVVAPPAPETAPTVLALTATAAELSDETIAALARALEADPALSVRFSADRLGGAEAAADIATALRDALPADRVEIAPLGFVHGAERAAEAGALVQLGPPWPPAVVEAFERGTPIFAVRGRLPGDRMVDSFLTAMGMEAFLFDDAAAAIAAAAEALRDPARRGEVLEGIEAARSAARESDVLDRWGDALSAVLMDAYRRYVSKGEAA
jgi:tetratricopeptide (TPR) repeat protein